MLAVGMGDEVQAMAAATGTAHFSEFDAIICRRFQTLSWLTTRASSVRAPNAGEDGAGRGAGKFSAATARKYSAVQQGIEDGLQNLEITDPIDPELIRAAVLAARDEDDLRQRLAALVDKADPRFAQALERASFAAAVLGYVAADEQRT